MFKRKQATDPNAPNPKQIGTEMRSTFDEEGRVDGYVSYQVEGVGTCWANEIDVYGVKVDGVHVWTLGFDDEDTCLNCSVSRDAKTLQVVGQSASDNGFKDKLKGVVSKWTDS